MTDRDEPLVVVCGVPGVGKSTVARAIKRRLDATLLRTDVVRKELFEQPSYAETETDTVYETVLERAESHLSAGAVVLDGTFRTRERRTRAAHLAETTGVPFRLVTVECDRQVVRDRIRSRNADPSDADFEIYERLSDEFESPTRTHTVIDNSGSLADTRQRVADLFE